MNKSIKHATMVSLLSLSTLACDRVAPGHVGVIVSLYGDNKGVNEKAVGVGKYWIGFNEELFVFPTFSKTYSWTLDKDEGSPNDESLNFQDKEGLFVNTDVGITWSISADNAVKVFQKFRKGVDEINDTFLRNTVRSALVTEGAKYRIEEIMGAQKETLMTAVQTRAIAEASVVGITVEKVFFLGRFKLPDTVRAALDEKVKATQKAMQIENEVRQTRAEAEKQIVQAEANARARLTEAKAEAEANRMLASSVTPELVKLKEIEAQMTAAGKWNGALPTQMIPGGSIPFVNVGGK
jgi:regulator of protease activity HflC (stomatin/prohibitin superfamily)